MFQQYINYIKDNPQKYWFKRKLYGYGWIPATWQGWLVIAVFVIFIIFQGMMLDLGPEGTTDIVLFSLDLFFTVIALLLICKITGEKPRWQWGIPKKDSENV
jgi:hypothetical protein